MDKYRWIDSTSEMMCFSIAVKQQKVPSCQQLNTFIDGNWITANSAGGLF